MIIKLFTRGEFSATTFISLKLPLQCKARLHPASKLLIVLVIIVLIMNVGPTGKFTLTETEATTSPSYSQDDSDIQTHSTRGVIEINCPEYLMNPGASVIIDGKTITLTDVGPTTVVVEVDGVAEVVGSNTQTINGIQIKLISSTPK